MTDLIGANQNNSNLLATHNKLPAGDGIEWLKQAWGIFKNDFIIWLVMIVAWLATAFVVSWIPLIGSFAISLATPVVLAGFFYAAHQAYLGNKVEFEHLLYGFKNKLEPLLILGAIQLVFFLALGLITVAVFGIGGAAMIASAAANSSGSMALVMIMGLIATLLTVLISVPFTMAMLYAPILVLFHDMGVTQALSRSFKACLSNWLPWLLFSIVVTVLLMLSVLTLGLGGFVVAALCTISVYISYRSVFLKV